MAVEAPSVLKPALLKMLKFKPSLPFEMLSTEEDGYQATVTWDLNATLFYRVLDKLLPFINEQVHQHPPTPTWHPYPYTEEEVLSYPLFGHPDGFIHAMCRRGLNTPGLVSTFELEAESLKALRLVKRVGLRSMVASDSTTATHDINVAILDRAGVFDRGYIDLVDIRQRDSSELRNFSEDEYSPKATYPSSFKEDFYRLSHPTFVVDDSFTAIRRATKAGAVAFWVTHDLTLNREKEAGLQPTDCIVPVKNPLEAAQQMFLLKRYVQKMLIPSRENQFISDIAEMLAQP